MSILLTVLGVITVVGLIVTQLLFDYSDTPESTGRSSKTKEKSLWDCLEERYERWCKDEQVES